MQIAFFGADGVYFIRHLAGNLSSIMPGGGAFLARAECGAPVGRGGSTRYPSSKRVSDPGGSALLLDLARS